LKIIALALAFSQRLTLGGDTTEDSWHPIIGSPFILNMSLQFGVVPQTAAAGKNEINFIFQIKFN